MAAAAVDPAQQQDDFDDMLTPKVRLAVNVSSVVLGVIFVLWGWLGHGEDRYYRMTMWIVVGCAFLSATAYFTCDCYGDSAAKRETTQPASPLDVESAGELRFASNPKE